MKVIKILTIIASCMAVVFLTSAMLPAPTSNPPSASDEVNNTQNSNQKTVIAYFFWGVGCPHCDKEKEFLSTIKDKYPQLEIKSYEIYENPDNQKLFKQIAQKCEHEIRGVPAFILGNEYIEGYLSDEVTGRKIEDQIKYCIQDGCSDPLKSNQDGQCESKKDEIVNYPIIGRLNLNKLSLPVLTIVLGTLDGFNPCSMWALIMLITLLINTNSKKKMWIIGGIFILASSLSYFLFLTAWMNLFMFIGILGVTRLIVGALAVFAGVYFLKDYWKNRKSNGVTCAVTTSKTKNKIVARIQKVTQSGSFWAIAMGTILIAFTVNMVELICSVGLPTIYTRILTLNQLSTWQYYAYLLLYDFFYMLDDIVVLIIAGMTFRLFVSNQKYAKYSHLVGGILIFILGLILIINPNLLMFK